MPPDRPPSSLSSPLYVSIAWLPFELDALAAADVLSLALDDAERPSALDRLIARATSRS